MDLSYAEDEEAELQTAEQHSGIRRCYVSEAFNTCVQGVRCVSSARLLRADTLPLSRSRAHGGENAKTQ
jgi:hypothetical protein